MAQKGSALTIALLSDIHCNIEALTACLTHAETRGASRYAFLGDFMGYGGAPLEVLEVIERYLAQGAVAVKGNHDEAIAGDSSYLNDSAHAAIEHERALLPAAQKKFLAGLPLLTREQNICLVHASAHQPEKWHYIDSPASAARSMAAAERSYTFCGHVHDQRLYFEVTPGRVNSFRPVPGTPIPVPHHRRWLALVGSVGQPRDRNPAAAYALFDPAREVLTFFRVPYDNFAAAARIRAAQLPESLAYRVERGI